MSSKFDDVCADVVEAAKKLHVLCVSAFSRITKMPGPPANFSTLVYNPRTTACLINN
jgi:hypothetical protein